MHVRVIMENGLCAGVEIDESLLDLVPDPVFVAMEDIKRAVAECVERRNEKAPES